MRRHGQQALAGFALVTTLGLLQAGCYDFDGLQTGGTDSGTKDGLKVDMPAKPSCKDSKNNGDETGVDCGGSTCPKCATGKGCKKSSDCISLVCDTSASKPTCKQATCDDKVRNGDETDVDCGGSCTTKCGNMKGCQKDADCQSGKCDTSVTPNVCKALPASCTDKKKNGSETDIDCGGKDCSACADGKACLAKTDCKSGVCTSNTCAAPSCSDGVKNGDETDVDCGGSCTTKCGASKSCIKNTDCNSGVCDSKVCKPASCSDKIMNGDETDVDCGGSCSTNCADLKKCKVAADCASGVCNLTKLICDTPTCTDAVKNGNETDQDCGGGTCPACADGKQCKASTDCTSKTCDTSVTPSVCKAVATSCNDMTKNGLETDIDCGGGTCPSCVDGKRCKVNGDCKNNTCDTTTTPNVCKVSSSATCTDGKKNAPETDVDCGGGTCPACANGKKCTKHTDCLSAFCQTFGLTQCATVPASCTNGILDVDEADVDCGLICKAKCASGKLCYLDTDCVSGQCDAIKTPKVCK